MKKSIRRRVKRQEKRLAKHRAGRRQFASGAHPAQKEDEEDSVALGQCKSTDKKQFILKLDDLVKLREHAIFIGKFPFMEIEFVGNVERQRWYLVHQVEFNRYFPKGVANE